MSGFNKINSPRKHLWTPSSVRRFHDTLGAHSYFQETFFTNEVGGGVLKFIKSYKPIKGRILDFGCGPGYLMNHLQSYPVQVWGIDFSPLSIKSANLKFKNQSKWKGMVLADNLQLPFDNDTFDMILIIETLEHLIPSQYKRILSEIKRVLKPGSGILFISTPYNEKLFKSFVYCPECSSIFHRYQHLQSFNVPSLIQMMTQAGFTTLDCNHTDFAQFQTTLKSQMLDTPVKYLASALLDIVSRIIDTSFGYIGFKTNFQINRWLGKGGHLFWIGTK